MYIDKFRSIRAELFGDLTLQTLHSPAGNFWSTGYNQWGAQHEDVTGSVVSVTDRSGVQQNQYQYDAFGFTYTLQTNLITPFRFVGTKGYFTDTNSGMELLGRRYYLPLLGRFLTQDPSGHETGPNLYAYVNNNPKTHADPSGLDTVVTRRGNTLIYTTNIIFFGEGATQAAMDRVVGVIKHDWNGSADYNKYNMEFVVNARLVTMADIAGGLFGPRPTADGIELLSAKGRSNVTHAVRNPNVPGRSEYSDYSRSRGGKWYLGDKYNGTFSHEYGHLLGLPDRYFEASQEPHPGYELSIMGPRGNLVERIDLEQALKAVKAYQPDLLRGR